MHSDQVLEVSRLTLARLTPQIFCKAVLVCIRATMYDNILVYPRQMTHVEDMNNAATLNVIIDDIVR